VAICWPKALPPDILRDPRRKAEIAVYERLCHELDDSFHVYYSSPWLGTDHLGAEKDGECDFLVAHAELGLLAIEVKGGEIGFDPRTGQWTSRDGHGFVHNIKDPVGQARSAKHALLGKLKDSGRWKSKWIHTSHGVIFPGAAAPPRDLGPDRPTKIFCCSKELRSSLPAWINERMGASGPAAECEPLGRDGLATLEDLLAKPFKLHFTLSARVGDAQDALRALTPRQYHVLDTIEDIARAEVRGGAGTGKTVIAMEEARRAGELGRRTLLTCHSRPLSLAMRRGLAGVPNLEIRSFHSLCKWAAGSAGIPIPNGVDEKKLFSEVLPNALVEAVERRPDLRWEEIVVDEGQDFEENWWIALESALAPHARLRVFSDSNQEVYGERARPPLDLHLIPIRLNQNLRNTQKIHSAASVHYQGPEIIAEGPHGVEVEWLPVQSDADLPSAVLKSVRSLVQHEEFDAGDIAVLLPGAEDVAGFDKLASTGGLKTTDAESMEPDRTVVDTVRRFKGLERTVVIVAVPSRFRMQSEIAYVALSRAAGHLVVAATPGTIEWLRSG
jgi:Nuclease-related domain/AAA domain